MKIILSPAKKMRQDTDWLLPTALPEFIGRTEELLQALRQLSYGELKALWGCSDAIAAENMERLRTMELRQGLSPAVLAYDGIAYQHMAPSVFSDGELDYIQEHLRILSGFYGVLRPLDGVRPYRLEMQAPLAVGEHPQLYSYWGDALYRALRDEDGLIIDLASEEYARCVEKYLAPGDRFIRCVFGELRQGRVVQKATFAKMARGEMVRFMAENNIRDPGDLRAFDRMGCIYHPELSREDCYVFEGQTGKK